jgi:hypothetical protein
VAPCPNRIPYHHYNTGGADSGKGLDNLHGANLHSTFSIIREKTMSTLRNFLLIFLAAFGIFFMFLTAINTPTVYKSWGTFECVKVRPVKAGSCTQLPEKYSLVWVK